MPTHYGKKGDGRRCGWCEQVDLKPHQRAFCSLACLHAFQTSRAVRTADYLRTYFREYQRHRRANPEIRAAVNKRLRDRWRAEPTWAERRRQHSLRYYRARQCTPRVKAISRRRRILYALLVQRDGPGCGICNQFVAIDESSVDHIIRIADGGSDTPDNIRLAHMRCNHKRERLEYREQERTSSA